MGLKVNDRVVVGSKLGTLRFCGTTEFSTGPISTEISSDPNVHRITFIRSHFSTHGHLLILEISIIRRQIVFVTIIRMTTLSSPGIWAGVELDNAEGKNDGTVNLLPSIPAIVSHHTVIVP